MDRFRGFAMVGAVYLGTFMATLDISIVNVALPTMQAALRTDIGGLQWVVDAYALCLSALMLSAGPLGDRYGRKRAWLAGVALFTAGSALCALAPGLALLLAGRAVQGAAGALLIPGALSILTHAFAQPRERARAIGGWSSFSAVALVAGPILGGMLVSRAGWPSIFLINLPLGLLTLALGAWGIRETSDPEHAAFDPAGQVLGVLWLGALTYGMISAGEAGWDGVRTLAALLAGAAGFMAFLAVEARAKRPVLPLSLFHDPVFSAANAASFVLGFSSYSSVFFLSLFFQQVQGWSAAATGWAMAPQFIGMAVVAAMFGRAAACFGLFPLMVAGYGLIGASMLALCFFGADSSYYGIGATLVVLGCGSGLAVPATSTAVMAGVAKERSGMASATTNAIRQTGMTVGVALLASFMAARASLVLAEALRQAGVADAGRMAQAAVTRHEFGAQAGLAAQRFQALFAQAYAQGFHFAMACAGAASMLISVVVWVVARRHSHSAGLQAAT